MTSSLEGEGWVRQKVTSDDILTGGGGGGVRDWWRNTIFYWHYRQTPNLKYISRVISNQNIEWAVEPKRWSSATWRTLFCHRTILLASYAYKRGRVTERWPDDKSYDFIYEQPFTQSVQIFSSKMCSSYILAKDVAPHAENISFF